MNTNRRKVPNLCYTLTVWVSSQLSLTIFETQIESALGCPRVWRLASRHVWTKIRYHVVLQHCSEFISIYESLAGSTDATFPCILWVRKQIPSIFRWNIVPYCISSSYINIGNFLTKVILQIFGWDIVSYCIFGWNQKSYYKCFFKKGTIQS